MDSIRDMSSRFFKWLAGRLPDTQNILGVYSVIVALIYSWTLITSFYKVPSWLFYLTLGQISSMYAYFFCVNLVESLLMLMGALLLEFTIFLPLKNREEFQSRSIVVVFTILFSTMARLLLYKSFEASEAFLNGELTWWVVTFLLGILFAIFIPKIKKARKVIEDIAERLSVLLYMYIPLTIISLIIVIARNIN